MLLTLVPYPLRRSVGCVHADRGKAGFQPALGPGSPAHILPLGIGQHVFGRDRYNIWDGPPTRTAPSSNWPDELHTDRVHLEMTGDADGPGKIASCEPLAEWRAEAVTGIRQHGTEANTGRDYVASANRSKRRTRGSLLDADQGSRSDAD